MPEDLIQRLLKMQDKGSSVQELLVEAYEAGYATGYERGRDREYLDNLGAEY